MAVKIQNHDGTKINISGVSSTGVKMAKKVLDKKKDTYKDSYMLKQNAISEAHVGCVEDLNSEIGAVIAALKSEASADAAAASIWGDDDVHGPAMSKAMNARANTISSMESFLKYLQVYLNMTKPNAMYFSDGEEDDTNE